MKSPVHNTEYAAEHVVHGQKTVKFSSVAETFF